MILPGSGVTDPNGLPTRLARQPYALTGDWDHAVNELAEAHRLGSMSYYRISRMRAGYRLYEANFFAGLRKAPLLTKPNGKPWNRSQKRQILKTRLRPSSSASDPTLS